jgi:hypothetical protein
LSIVIAQERQSARPGIGVEMAGKEHRSQNSTPIFTSADSRMEMPTKITSKLPPRSNRQYVRKTSKEKTLGVSELRSYDSQIYLGGKKW